MTSHRIQPRLRLGFGDTCEGLPFRIEAGASSRRDRDGFGFLLFPQAHLMPILIFGNRNRDWNYSKHCDGASQRRNAIHKYDCAILGGAV